MLTGTCGCVCYLCVSQECWAGWEVGLDQNPVHSGEKPKDSSSPPFSLATGGQPGKFICNSLYEDIYFTSDHTPIHESPLFIIIL